MRKYFIFVFILSAVAATSFFSCTKEHSGKNDEQKKNSIQSTGEDKNDSESSKKKKSDTMPVVTFIELGSVDCVPCKMMQPVMDQVEEKYGEKVKVIFYDIWTDEDKDKAKEYGIRSIPTQIFLDANGNEYFRHVGFFPFEQLDAVLKHGGVE